MLVITIRGSEACCLWYGPSLGVAKRFVVLGRMDRMSLLSTL
jgi:hypothetical protein